MEECHFRDPVHGFVAVRPLERKIIDSKPFQRLRGVKQLALSNLVYHGAEHTRFGHSIGVMHLVTKVNSVIKKKPDMFTYEKTKWYEQILRLIALTHDLGHAPFSHGSEDVFPDGLEHEDYSDKIIMETDISNYIKEIGNEFVQQYGQDFDIDSQLICSVYRGRNITDPDFIFLRKFIDSELDCDKMDYLLRDSLYCGVNYGKYDVDRLISSLSVYQHENNKFLAIESGGKHAFEEFVLARYFMFVQVYFHRTRRFLDKMLVKYLKSSLPEGTYPRDVKEYLKWDDYRVWTNLKNDVSNSFAESIVCRKINKMIYQSPTHSITEHRQIYNLLKEDLKKNFPEDKIMYDTADKFAHKIPLKHEIDSERAIPVIVEHSDEISTISRESLIVRKLVEPINILRVYASSDIASDASDFIRDRIKIMND